MQQYAELHLHLGGAILPRILYTYLERNRRDTARPEAALQAAAYLRKFPTYERFERRLTRKCDSLSQYLEKHALVEPIQRLEAIPYLINRMLRGTYTFENVVYLELRYNPYFRIAKETPKAQTLDRMAEVVAAVAASAVAGTKLFPIVFTQILCMDTRLPRELNEQIIELAAEAKEDVCAIDLAGPDTHLEEKAEEFEQLFIRARSRELKVTAHLFETPNGCVPRLLEYVHRIGHGIQIPLRFPSLLTGLAKRKQCLEICPTTYFRTGTLKTYAELKPVFRDCFDLGVDVAICTDNSALHEVRLPLEYERLLTHGVIDFSQMERCREAAFRHAFRWPGRIDRRDRY